MEPYRESVGVPFIVEVVARADVPRARGEGLVGVEAEGVKVRRTVAVDLVGADEVCYSKRVGGERGL